MLAVSGRLSPAGRVPDVSSRSGSRAVASTAPRKRDPTIAGSRTNVKPWRGWQRLAGIEPANGCIAAGSGISPARCRYACSPKRPMMSEDAVVSDSICPDKWLPE